MMMLALISLVISVLSQNADGYTTCTSSAYKSRKYTFKVDISTYEKVWSHCEFPNPLFDLPQCGRNQTSVTNYVCDPDYMLGSVSEGKLLLDFSLTVKAAPHECVIRTSQP